MVAVMTVMTDRVIPVILRLHNRGCANADHQCEQEECLLHGAIVASPLAG